MKNCFQIGGMYYDGDDTQDVLRDLAMPRLRSKECLCSKTPIKEAKVASKQKEGPVKPKQNNISKLIRCHICGEYVSLVRAKKHVQQCTSSKYDNKERIDSRLPTDWEAARDPEDPILILSLILF